VRDIALVVAAVEVGGLSSLRELGCHLFSLLQTERGFYRHNLPRLLLNFFERWYASVCAHITRCLSRAPLSRFLFPRSAF